jgi:hypothetical protein
VTVDVEGLPRRNGELAFDEPWQPRVFGLAAGVVETSCAGDWEPFRRRLVAALAEVPERPYWRSWTVALEALLVDHDLVPQDELDRLEGAGLGHDHRHDHGHGHSA